MTTKRTAILLSITVPLLLIIAFLMHSEVDNALTEEDRQYIPKYLGGTPPLPRNPTYREQLDFIMSVQHSVLRAAPRNEGLPFGQKREPKELYTAGTGLCFDRSRVIEKILRQSGFETRHIALYSKRENASAVSALLTPGIRSHAVTEVLTSEGWLVVDSNAPWVSVDQDNQPVPILEIQSSIEKSSPVPWPKDPPSAIYSEPFLFVYGLYARHGKFYPPYNVVPDINYGELLQNLRARIALKRP
jgi:hypothetical protein